MKKSRKKTWVAWLLAAAMLMEAAPMTVLADEIIVEDSEVSADVTEEVTAEETTVITTGACGDDITFTLYDDGLLELTGTGAMWDWEYSPDTNTGLLTAEQRELVTALKINEGITYIGDYAFYNCSGFTGPLTIPDSVTSIGYHTFYGCSGFTGPLTIPDSVTFIGFSAFYSCSGFTGPLTISESLTSIGHSVFAFCSGLTGPLMLPESLNYISYYAFAHCTGFTGSLTIPAGVIEIRDNGFTGCSSITEVVFEGTTPPTFGTNVFTGMSSLTSVKVPAESYEAYVEALDGAVSSDKIVSYNTDISVSPASGSNISGGLLNVTLTYPPYADGNNLTVTAVDTDGNSYEVVVETMNAIENGMEYTLDISSLPSGEYTFTFTLSDDLKLEGVVYDIANYDKIEGLEVDDFYSGHLYLMWDNTGYENQGKNVIVEMQSSDDTWITILSEEYGFNHIDVDLSSSYTDLTVRVKIEDTTGTVLAMSDPLQVITDGFTYSVSGGNVTITGYAGSSSSVAIPETIAGYPVTAVDFSDMGLLEISSLSIPAGVTSITSRTLDNLDFLRKITVAEDNPVYSSDSYGVLYDKEKTEIIHFPKNACYESEYVIPGTVTTIPEDCFGRSYVASVFVPASVTSIGADAFQQTSELTEITVAEDNAYYSSDEHGVLFNKDKSELIRFPYARSVTDYTVPDSVVALAENAFYYCQNISGAVYLPEGLVTIGECAFDVCSNITAVNIPSTVESIGYMAFFSCDELTAVTIPKAVVSIADSAFAYCDNLTSVTVLSENVVFGSDVFEDCSNITIHAPAGSTAEEYAAANNIANTTFGTVTPAAGTIFGDETAVLTITLPTSDVPETLSVTAASQSGEIIQLEATVEKAEANDLSTLTITLNIGELVCGEYSIALGLTDVEPIAYLIDREAPAFTSITPADNSRIEEGASVVLEAAASDTIGVQTVEAKYSTDGETWESLGVVNDKAAIFTLNTAYITTDSVQVKYIVTDKSGKTTETIHTYRIGGSDDTVAPEIVSIWPEVPSTIGLNTEISVQVKDDIKLGTVTISWECGDQSGTYTIPVNDSGEETTFVTIPQDVLSLDGAESVTLNITCTDLGGNVSEPLEVTYKVDTTAPEAVSLSAEETFDGITLTWTQVNNDDLAGYRIYRKEGENIRQIKAFAPASGTSYNYKNTDRTVSYDKTYTYYVVTEDECGNTANSNEVTVSRSSYEYILQYRDTTKPTASMSLYRYGYINEVLTFDARNSSDNGEIKSYFWEFGDGSTAEGERVEKAFSEKGVYTVSLTVTDTAGNTDTQTASITIKQEEAEDDSGDDEIGEDSEEEYPDTGDLIVKVTDTSGNAVSGAKVCFNLKSESMQTFYTGSDGTVRIRDVGGIYEIGAYKGGYTPNTAEAEIVNGEETAVEIRMGTSGIVAGSLGTERMTLDEIEAAGIDVSDPDNQFVYKFEIELEYSTTPPSSSDNTLGGTNANSNTTSSKNSWTWTIPVNDKGEPFAPLDDSDDPEGPQEPGEPTVLEPPGSTEKIVVAPEFIPRGEGQAPLPVVSILTLPGEATWLKDFFEVSLEIVNLAPADSGIVLENCTADLTAPDGLTLMASDYTNASSTCRMDNIAAGYSEESVWILRGDIAGDYHLAADFNAELPDFNETVTAEFRTVDPIRVRAGNNLYMDVIVEDTIHVDADGAVRIGLRNEDWEPYYMPKIELEGVTQRGNAYKTSGGERYDSNLDTLHPGETIWFEFVIDRDDYSSVFEDPESDYYLVNQIAKYVDGVKLPTTFTHVDSYTISGDRVELATIDPVSGMENSLPYIDIDLDGLSAVMPDLVIRTYRLIDGEYQLYPMEFTLTDPLREAENKGSAILTAMTDENGEYIVSGYAISQLSNKEEYTLKLQSDRAAPIEIPVTVSRHNGDGKLEVTVYELDDNGKRILISGAAVVIDGKISAMTDHKGIAKFDEVENGQREIKINAPGYHEYEGTVKVKDEIKVSRQLRKKTSGSYVYEIQMSLSPDGSAVIIPEKLATGNITFELKSHIESGEKLKQYWYKICDADGKEVKSGSFNSSSYTLNIADMKVGYRISFAVETDIEISDYLQADLHVIPCLSLLGNIVAPNLTFLTNTKTKISIGKKTFENLTGFIPAVKKSLIGNYDGLNDKDPEAAKKVDDFTSNVKGTTVAGEPEKFYVLDLEIDYAKGEITASLTGGKETPYQFIIDGEKRDIGSKAFGDETRTRETSGKLIFRYDTDERCWKWSIGFDGKMSWEMILVPPVRLAGSFLALMFSADLVGEAYTDIELPGITIEESGTTTDMQDGMLAFVSERLSTSDAKFELGASGGVKFNLYEQLFTESFQSAGIYLETLFGLKYEAPATINPDLIFRLGWESKLLFIFSNSGVIAEIDVLDPVAYTSLRRTLSDPSTTYSIVTAPKSVQWNNTPADNILQSEVFSGAQQQIVTLDNGTKLMVYADTDQSFDADNPVKLKYSVNNDGTWSDPEVVCTDDTVDLQPSLTVAGNKAVLTWTDMGQELSEVSTMTTAEIRELYATMEIRMAEFNGDSWSDPVTVTENKTAGLVHESTAASDGQTTMIAWLSNENGTESADAENPDTIRYALIAENGTTTGELAAAYSTASNLALTAVNGTYMMTCAAKNADGEYIAYKSIYNVEEGKWSEAEQISSLETQSLALTTADDGTVYYIMDGRLYRAGENGEKNAVLTVSDTLNGAHELSVLKHGGKTYFAWVGAASEGIGLYLCYMDESGVVSEPVPIVTDATERYDTPVLAPNGDDSILAVYLTAAEDEDYPEDYVLNYTLNCASIDLTQDISVTDVSHSQPLYAGAEVTTAFACENLGLLSVSDVTASIYDADGNLVETADGSGLTDIIVWTVPDDYDGEVYTLKVVPASGTDEDDTNNIVSIDYAFTDLEAVDVNYVGEEGEDTSLILSLKNNGLVTSRGVTAVVEDRMTDTVLAEIDLGDIAGGAETDHRISVNRGEYTDLTVTVKTEGFDLASDNNKVYLLIDDEITIEALPEKENAEITIIECSTTLAGKIGVNFYIDIPEKAAADDNARIRFTQIKADGSEVITEVPAADALQEDGIYKFSCAVAAKEMADTIKAKFVSDSYESAEYPYTVKQYVETMLNAPEDTYSDEAIALAKAMLYYGGYAQTEFGYNTDALAYDELLDSEYSGVDTVTADDLAGFSHTMTKKLNGVTFVGSRLVLESETKFQPYFRIDEGVLENITFTYNGQKLTPVQVGDYYRISIDNIAARDLDAEHTVTISNGTDTTEMMFVPLTYAKDVHAQLSSDRDLVNVVNALYLYNAAANAYFEN